MSTRKCAGEGETYEGREREQQATVQVPWGKRMPNEVFSRNRSSQARLHGASTPRLPSQHVHARSRDLHSRSRLPRPANQIRSRGSCSFAGLPAGGTSVSKSTARSGSRSGSRSRSRLARPRPLFRPPMGPVAARSPRSPDTDSPRSPPAARHGSCP